MMWHTESPWKALAIRQLETDPDQKLPRFALRRHLFTEDFLALEGGNQSPSPASTLGSQADRVTAPPRGPAIDQDGRHVFDTMVIRDSEENALPHQGNRRQSAALIGDVVLAHAVQSG
jgi:hypothetical protein